jgi:uncharacterized membrane protein
MLAINAPDSDQHTAPSHQSGLAAKRVVVGALGGIAVAGIALAEGASWSVAALGATDVAALVFVAWVWISVASADAGATARLARAEDASRTAAEAVLLGAGAASLLAVGFTLAQASHAHAPGSGLLTALALASVALACLLASVRAALLHTAGWRDRFQGRASRLPRLRLPRTDDRDDVPSLGHRSHRQARPSPSAPSRSDLVRVRDRHRCDHGQLGRLPTRPIALALTRQPERR